MKKILASLILTVFLVSPIVGLAQEVPVDPDAVYKTINTVINWAFGILLIGAALVVIFAAYLFLTAGGDPDKTKTARNYILYALIAVVVAFLAKAIVVFVAKMLGIDVGGIIF